MIKIPLRKIDFAGWQMYLEDDFEPEKILTESGEVKGIPVKENKLRTVFAINTEDPEEIFYVKWDCPEGIMGKIKALFRVKSKAEYNAAKLLEEHKIPCVKYLGFATKNAASLLISKGEKNTENAIDYWLALHENKSPETIADIRKKYLENLSAFLKKFIGSNLYHPDMHLGNLLVKKDSLEFLIVDPYGIKKMPVLSDSAKIKMQRSTGALRGELSLDEAESLLISSGMAETRKEAGKLWEKIIISENAEMDKLWTKRKKQILSGKSKYCVESQEEKTLVKRTYPPSPHLDELTPFECDRKKAEQIWLLSFRLQFYRIPHLRPMVWKRRQDSKDILYFEKLPVVPDIPVSGEKIKEFMEYCSMAGVHPQAPTIHAGNGGQVMIADIIPMI